jgi:hypothetical protein
MYQTTETYRSYNAGPTAGTMGRWRTQTRIMYHLQKGDSAVVERFTPAVTRNFVQDYAPAMEFINVYDANRHSARIWSVVNTTAVLGGILLVMSNGIKDEKLTGAGYAGVGLTLGGIANGFINKIRKGQNYKNLELAIDAYNAQVVRKKRRP